MRKVESGFSSGSGSIRPEAHCVSLPFDSLSSGSLHSCFWQDGLASESVLAIVTLECQMESRLCFTDWSNRIFGLVLAENDSGQDQGKAFRLFE